MKLEIKVKSWNKYPPPWEGVGTYLTYLSSKDNYSWMRNCSVGPLKVKKLLSPKNEPIGLHKLHSVHGNSPGAVAGSQVCPLPLHASFACRPEMVHSLVDFPSSTDLRRAIFQLMAKEIVAK